MVLALSDRVIKFPANGDQIVRETDRSGSSILLLQGPVGSYFQHLQNFLECSGHDAWRVTFNAGDRAFCHSEKSIRFSDKLDNLESWYRALLEKHKFDCVILFGCERPVHKIAIDICNDLGLPVLSLEEGYIRPGYVTVEESGNNWRSPIAGKMPPENRDLRASKQREDGKSSFNQMAWNATRYFIAHGLLSRTHERENFHKRGRERLVSEAVFWNRNLIRKQRRKDNNFNTIEKLLECHAGRYVLVPFQVSDDGQLEKTSGLGWNNESLIFKTIESFANSAPADMHLVFKIHPLERGHCDYWNLVRRVAKLHNVSYRVHIVDAGSLGLLTRHSAAMITINSSSGFSAIFHGVPLGVMGKAIYDNPDLVTHLTKTSDLDCFWENSFVAPARVRKDYLSWMRACCLVEGDFYLKTEWDHTSEAITTKAMASIARSKVRSFLGDARPVHAANLYRTTTTA